MAAMLFGSTVAVAPRNTTRRLPSLRELDEDLRYSVPSAAEGLDMSLLTTTLVPPEMVRASYYEERGHVEWRESRFGQRRRRRALGWTRSKHEKYMALLHWQYVHLYDEKCFQSGGKGLTEGP